MQLLRGRAYGFAGSVWTNKYTFAGSTGTNRYSFADPTGTKTCSFTTLLALLVSFVLKGTFNSVYRIDYLSTRKLRGFLAGFGKVSGDAWREQNQ